MRRLAQATILAMLALAGCGSPESTPSGTVEATYLGGAARTADYPAQPGLVSATVLRPRWTLAPGVTVSSQPVSANHLLYWSGWDGGLHATRLDGTEAWRVDLGRTTAAGCDPPSAGPAGTPTLVTSGTRSFLYGAAGDGGLVALDARSGRQLWRVQLARPPAEYIWGSPGYLRGSVFVGVSSFGECATGRGRLLKISASDGRPQARFDVVPPDCGGGGIWGSPALDDASGLVYVATGDADPCARPTPFAFALVALRASDLVPVDHWQVPRGEQVEDSDFGSTPTLAARKGGGKLVGLANKNGRYYLFDASHLARGPLWSRQVADGGSCPYCGDGSIAPSAWDGQSLYVGGGRTEVAGQACSGGLRALDPAGGSVRWEACFASGPVLAAPVVAGDVVVVGAGPDLFVLKVGSGQRLAHFADPDRLSAFLGAALPFRGLIFTGTANGRFYALEPAAS